MNIVCIAAEVFPFAKTGGLADVCGALFKQFKDKGHQVSLIMPYYRCVGEKPTFNKIARRELLANGVKVYFIENKRFFARSGLYGNRQADYEDNLERFSYFCHTALSLLKGIGVPVDILHCHDWQTGLIPVILKQNHHTDVVFQNTKVVFTVHNLAYQGIFPKIQYSVLDLDSKWFDGGVLEFGGKINLMKAGLVCSDAVTTVSPQYAKEISRKEWGYGLHEHVKGRDGTLFGILNGLDYDQWDPRRDVFVNPPFSENIEISKATHKKKLQEMCGLPVNQDIPIFGFVGRLCYQKGLDLLDATIRKLAKRNIQIVVQGVGEEEYHQMLTRVAKEYPQIFSAQLRYDEDVAHQIFSGSDFFLMPSVYEPCGLTQMIALRYGTIPVVSSVGGLIDTIVDYGSGEIKANGFLFSPSEPSQLIEAIDRASEVFEKKEEFAELRSRGMACRWTWSNSAEKYLEVYKTCLS